MKKFVINKTLTFYVKPNSSKTRLIGYSEKKKALIVELKAKPENNKANEELIKLVEKETGDKAKIIKGKTSKLKVVKLM